MHEDYNKNGDTNNDIAVLELTNEITGVTPIKMLTPEMEATLTDGFEFTVMGWGNTDTENPQYPNILREVVVPLYNREACAATYPQLTEQMICAGLVEGGKDSCQGDSGGPLVFQREGEWYQAGVVSFGNGCAEANNPGVYARVSQFNDWITAKTAGVSYPQFIRNGFVELEYDEVVDIEIKNVGQTAYQVTGVNVDDVNNIAPVTITNNTCENQSLEYNQTCTVSVKVAASNVGEGSFQVNLTTNKAENTDVPLFFRMNSLASESLDVATHAGSSDSIAWWGGGDANWESQTTKVVSGDSAIASGTITDQQASVLLATINSDSVNKFSFQYLVESEQDYDFLQVRHNNNVVLNASGTSETEFQTFTVDLSPGKDRIALIYVKDSTDEDEVGADKAFVDNISVEITNQAPVAAVAASTITAESGNNITLDASSSTDPEADQLTYAWVQVSGPSVELSNATQASITVATPDVSEESTLVFEVTVTDTAGSTSKASVTVTVQPKPAEQPTTPAPTNPAPTTPSSSGGGSFGGILLLIASLAIFRRVNLHQSQQ